MTIVCNNFDNLLLEGDAYSMRVAAEHAATCGACAEKLAAWNDIARTARGMRAEWTNEMLWPRIERAIRDDRKRSRAWMWQIAAAFVLFALLGFGAWRAYRQSRSTDFDKVILRQSAIERVDAAEKAHLAAIDDLEKIAAPKLEDPSSPLLVSYKEKLMLLDDAIAECQTAIDHNRQNAQIRRQLLAMYSEKQQTLEDVLREDSHVSNQ